MPVPVAERMNRLSMVKLLIDVESNKLTIIHLDYAYDEFKKRVLGESQDNKLTQKNPDKLLIRFYFFVT